MSLFLNTSIALIPNNEITTVQSLQDLYSTLNSRNVFSQVFNSSSLQTINEKTADLCNMFTQFRNNAPFVRFDNPLLTGLSQTFEKIFSFEHSFVKEPSNIFPKFSTFFSTEVNTRQQDDLKKDLCRQLHEISYLQHKRQEQESESGVKGIINTIYNIYQDYVYYTPEEQVIDEALTTMVNLQETISSSLKAVDTAALISLNGDKEKVLDRLARNMAFNGDYKNAFIIFTKTYLYRTIIGDPKRQILTKIQPRISENDPALLEIFENSLRNNDIDIAVASCYMILSEELNINCFFRLLDYFISHQDSSHLRRLTHGLIEMAKNLQGVTKYLNEKFKLMQKVDRPVDYHDHNTLQELAKAERLLNSMEALLNKGTQIVPFLILNKEEDLARNLNSSLHQASNELKLIKNMMQLA